jgi:putative ABC transport system ATP-binding protein
VTLLALDAVVKRHDGRVALAPASLQVDAGELALVVGAARTGKTTLVEIAAGWIVPDEGSATWDGSRTAPPWSMLTVVPQTLALIDELTVLENVMLPARAARLAVRRDRDRAMAQLERLGLERLADRAATEISVGERQRVMVARALWTEPHVVLVDEPTAHQDAVHADAVVAAIVDAVTRGAACIVASRSRDVVPRADRVLELAPPELLSSDRATSDGRRSRG